MTPDKSPTYLLYDFFGETENQVDLVKHNLTQLRNYNSAIFNKEPNAISINIGNILAEALNSTLIGKGHPHYFPQRYPTYVPLVTLLSPTGQTVENYWNLYWKEWKGKQGLPLFYLAPTLHLNFAYCAETSVEQKSSWDFSIFTTAFDSYTWLCISLSVLLIGLLTRSKSFISTLIYTVSALLSVGGTIRSPLFVLWMLVTLVMITMYTGDMTSHITCPSKEQTISNISELEKQNYTLFFGDPMTPFVVNAVIQALAKKEFVSADTKTLHRLLSSAEQLDLVKDGDTRLYGKTIVAKSSLTKLATVSPWPFAISAANSGNNYIMENSKNSGKILRKKCYIGSKLIPVPFSYTGLLPPDNGPFKMIFEIFRASGIHDRWINEFLSMGIASRVQDRAKFRSPINIVDIRNPGVTALHMKQGQMGAIFLLWTISLVVSSACYICEIGFHGFTATMIASV